jgi:hypothetical protein
MDFAEDLQDTTGWVAWGINPTGIYMPGTQALAAFSNSSGVVVKEYNVTEAVFNGQANLMSGPVSLNYTDIHLWNSGSGSWQVDLTQPCVESRPLGDFALHAHSPPSLG